MAKLPTNLGQRAIPRATRGIASIDPSTARGAGYEAARLTKAGFDSVAGGLEAVEEALYKRTLENEEREVKRLQVEFARESRLINQRFKQTQGESTLKARTTLDKEYLQARENIRKRASSTRVGQAFDILAQGRVEMELEQADGYTEAQRLKANNDASQAVMAEAFQAAAENPLDEVQSVLYRKTIEAEVDAQARINGWSVDVTKSKKEEAVSQFYKARVIASAKDHPDAAWAIYEKNKDSIDGDVRIEIEKHLEDVTLEVMAQNYAEQAIAKFPKDIKAQREYIRETLSGKKEAAALDELHGRLTEYQSDIRWADYLEDQAYQRIARQEALDRKEETDSIKDARRAASKAITDGMTLGDWVVDNPEQAGWLAQDDSAMKALNAYEILVAEGKEYANTNDTKTMTQFLDMEDYELANLSDEDMEALKPFVNKSTWERFGKYRDAAKTKMENIRTNQAIYDTGYKLLFDYAPKVRKEGKDKLTISEDAMNIAHMEMDAFIKTFTDKGKFPSREELARESQRLMLEIVADPRNTGLGIPPLLSPKKGEEEWEGVVAEMKTMSPQQRANARVDIEDVPADMRLDIEADIEAAGMEIDNDLISQLAAAIALRDAARYNSLLGR